MKWTIGDVTVTKIVELEVTGGSRFLLPQATPGGDQADRLAADRTSPTRTAGCA